MRGSFSRIRTEHAGTPRGDEGRGMRKRPMLLSMNWARDHYCAELLTLINYCSVGFWRRGP